MAADQRLVVRVTDDELSAFKKAAELAGLKVAEWVRMHCRRATIREHQEIGLEPPLLPRD